MDIKKYKVFRRKGLSTVFVIAFLVGLIGLAGCATTRGVTKTGKAGEQGHEKKGNAMMGNMMTGSSSGMMNKKGSQGNEMMKKMMGNMMTGSSSGMMNKKGSKGNEMMKKNVCNKMMKKMMGNMMTGSSSGMMNKKGSKDHKMMKTTMGNMMVGMMNGRIHVKTINKNELKKLLKTPSKGVKINRKTNTIEYSGKKIIIPIIASPSEKAMYAFGVYGLVNPTIVVHKGTTVKLLFVNKDDDMFHGVMITSAAPPYPYMAMMLAPVVYQSSFIRPVRYYESGGKYPETSSIFYASKSGIFYYICQVPGHAHDKMYGKFVVVNK